MTVRIFTCFFLFLLHFGGQAGNEKDYIITKDKKIITGEIAKIFYSEWISEITFVNDVGTKYKFHPWLIFGFVVQGEQNKEVLYESKYEHGCWRFLKVLEKGKGMNLYGCPPQKTRQIREVWGYVIYSSSWREFWIEPEREFPFRVYRTNYKRKLRKYLDAPDILAKLGTEGYRYKDIPKIVREYNTLKKGAKL